MKLKLMEEYNSVETRKEVFKEYQKIIDDIISEYQKIS